AAITGSGSRIWWFMAGTGFRWKTGERSCVQGKLGRMLRRLNDTLASIWTWAILGSLVVLCFPLILVWRILGGPLDPWNYAGGLLFRRIAWAVQAVTPRWRFEQRGRYPADPRLPYVAVANHE